MITYRLEFFENNIRRTVEPGIRAHSFSTLAAVASEIYEILQNSEKMRTYSSSRLSKVIDLGVNGNRICDFLLVTNSNFERISHRFREPDIDI